MSDANTPSQHAFPCQQCGSQLTYQPGSEEMHCLHCGHQHRISLSVDPIYEYDFYATLKNQHDSAPKAVAQTVVCSACSAEFDFAKSIHADECPFCGTAVVVDSNPHQVIAPKSLLPFGIDAKSATESYRSWLKGLWFAPNKLKKYARKERQLNGIYVPYWTYDCATYSRYSGRRGDLYQVPQRVSVVVNGRRTTQTRMVTKIRWRNVSGAVQRSFDDVLICASESLPREMVRELAPWDLNTLVPYQQEFLSGFQSEVYQLELEPGFDIARQRMHPHIRRDIRRDIGGDRQQIHQLDTQYSEIRFKHILLPFWVAGFRFRKKTYQFVVNGRTGEVQGQRPYSWVKITFAVIFLLLLAVIAGEYFLQHADQLQLNTNF